MSSMLGAAAPVSSVVKHLDRIAGEDRLGEQEQRHFRAPQGPLRSGAHFRRPAGQAVGIDADLVAAFGPERMKVQLGAASANLSRTEVAALSPKWAGRSCDRRGGEASVAFDFICCMFVLI